MTRLCWEGPSGCWTRNFRIGEWIGDRPALRAEYEKLRKEARRAHAVREEQSRVLTLAWPVLRRAILRIGHDLCARGVVTRRDDVFSLEKNEIRAAMDGPAALTATAEVRPQHWERQRRLRAPLLIGKMPAMYEKGFTMIEETLRGTSKPSADELHGHPGSPGSVTGPARIVRHAEEIGRLRPGEIPVAPVTTPAWTPAFLRAAGVVTDTGSFASHASIVAREYGLPAVVATGDATSRFRDGEILIVDGSRGIVRRVS